MEWAIALRENTMTNSKAFATDQPMLDQLLANIFATDNWGALMRRYVSAGKPQPTADKQGARQLKDVGLTRAYPNPARTNEPRRYQGDL
jgi:hypothetical protein